MREIRLAAPWGKTHHWSAGLRFRICTSCSLIDAGDAHVTQFFSVLPLLTTVFLTVCFGMAAWDVLDEGSVETTGQIPRRSYGTRPTGH